MIGGRSIDHYLGMLLGIAFLAVGIHLLWAYISQIVSGKGRLPYKGLGGFVPNIPLIKSAPIFAALWVIAFGVSTIAIGLYALIYSVIYANKQHLHPTLIVVFWLIWALCLSVAGLLGPKASFGERGPIWIFFMRVACLAFALIVLWLGYLYVAHFDVAAFQTELTACYADIQSFLKTGIPLE